MNTNNEVARNRMKEIYGVMVEMHNRINTIEETNEDYFKKNWSIAIDGLSQDLETMADRIKEQGFSFDYPEASTFVTFLQLFNYSVDELINNYIPYEDGIGIVNMVKNGIRQPFLPLVAKVVLRVQELDIIKDLPPVYHSVYNRYIEEAGDLVNSDIGEVFNFVFESEESLEDDLYVEQVKSNINDMFGGSKDLTDFQDVRTKLTNYILEKSNKDQLDINF